MGDELWLLQVISHFCSIVKFADIGKSITNSQTVGKIMPYHISSNGSAGGCFPALPLPCGISPLTCTIFDSTYFGGILRNHVFHISPTRLKSSIMGNYLDFALKIAHRGNTGAHKGKRKLLCVLEK